MGMFKGLARSGNGVNTSLETSNAPSKSLAHITYAEPTHNTLEICNACFYKYFRALMRLHAKETHRKRHQARPEWSINIIMRMGYAIALSLLDEITKSELKSMKTVPTSLSPSSTEQDPRRSGTTARDLRQRHQCTSPDNDATTLPLHRQRPQAQTFQSAGTSTQTQDISRAGWRS